MSTDTTAAGVGEEELNISCSINAEIYPDLYAALLKKSKGPRSELLRALANEALTARRFAASTQAKLVPPSDESGNQNGERPRGY